MGKNKNLYLHEGKLYTQENRVAKVGEKVLITHSISRSFKDGDILTVIRPLGGKDLVMSNEMILSDSEYVVLVPRINGMEITDTWYDEMTCMEQPKYEVLYGGIGSKKQPVPFSKEYYNAPRKVQIGDWVEALTAESGEIIQGGKYQVLALNNYGSYGVYVRSPLPSFYDGDCSNGKIRQPFSYLTKTQYKLCPEPTVADTINSISKIPKEQYTLKRKWVESEITESKRYVADKMYSLTKERKFICFYGDTAKPTETIAVLYERTTPSWGAVQDNNLEISTDVVRKAIAKCMPTDEQNDDVGKMVATKKLFNEQLPAWIRKEDKE